MATIQEALLALQARKSPFETLLEGVAGGVSNAQDKSLENARILIQMEQERQDRERRLENDRMIRQQIASQMEAKTQQGMKATGTPATSPMPAQRLKMGITTDEKGYLKQKWETVEPKVRDPLEEELMRAKIKNLNRPPTDTQMKPPPGFRWTPDGNLEAIPGGPADLKLEKEQRKEQGLQDAAITQAELVISKVDQALSKVGMNTAGLGGSLMRKVPGSEATDLERDIDTIKANLGFATLQEMRRNSPTGGALGQVAVQELNMLQSTVASLDTNQSPEQLRQRLKEVKGHYANWKKAVMDSLNSQGTSRSRGEKIKVSNGKETLMIDPSDAADAAKDGYQAVP